jgi:gluconate 2-dehydrogenase
MKPRIYIDRPIPQEVEDYLAEYCSIDVWRELAPIPRATLLDKLESAAGLLTAGAKIDEELLSRAPGLKAVSSSSVGYNHYDLEAMKRHGIIGTNTPHVLDETVADLVFALILGCARRVAELDRYVREGKWVKGLGDAWFGTDVHHKTMGIIGMGRIGEAVAKRARYGFDMDVFYFNRTRKLDAEQQLGVRYAELDELLATSDYVVILVPLTPVTSKLIGREQFELMKPTAFFINASRGQTVDEGALLDALQGGKIAGAGLDVFEQEPVPADHPLLLLPNVLALPHIGSATAQTRLEMAKLAARNLVDALSGNTPANVVRELM